MTPRLLFLDHAGVLGGAELSLLDIVRAFRRQSRVVLFEDGPFREALADAGVETTVLASPAAVGAVARTGGIGRDVRAVPGVLSHARRVARLAREADVVYANSQKAMVIGAVAAALARKPLMWHLRDLMTAEHFSTLHRTVAVRVGGQARRVIANSDATRRAFVEAGGPPDRTVTVHNGIDGAPYEASRPERRAALRRSLGIGGAPLVGVFSRLARWKGQHVAIEALGYLPGAHLVLVGDALFDADRPYAGGLRRQAAEAGLGDRVHFVGFRHDVPDWLHTVDVVAHTSTAPEPFGRVIVEGMLAGRPVVAAAAGGALEIVDPERTGVLVPPGDASALAVELHDLLFHPSRAAHLARAGRAEARRRFSLGALIDGVRREIGAVLSPEVAPPLAHSSP
jgi:glycosyltransferase involved in cell wall biosynthesis